MTDWKRNDIIAAVALLVTFGLFLFGFYALLRSEMRAGFDDVNGRLENVNTRIENVNTRIDDVNVRIDAMQETLAEVRERLATVEERMRGE